MSEGAAAPRPSRGLTPEAQLFVAAVGVCGIAVVARSVAVLWHATMPGAWLLFAILTVLSGTLSIKIPSIQSRFSVSEVFAFTSVLLFGPEVGALVLALDGLRISFLWKMNRAQTLFNFANLGLSMWVSAQLFFLASGAAPLYGGHAAPSAGIVLYLGLMTGAYFAINTLLTATAVALSARRSVTGTWREHYWPLFPSYLAGASVALLLVLAFREVQFTAIALILPLLLICYLTLRSSFGRLEDAKNHVEQLNRLLLSTVETLATAIDAKDEVTHDHVRRVQQGTLALARVMGVTDPASLQALEAAALLHDTGKIAVPEHILNKPGKLTAAEFEKMKRHAPIGAEILSSIEFPYPVVPIVRHHHENWDGTGYPDKLKGEAIPLGARLLSVVDCFDALTSDRPYRRRMTDAQALAILQDRRGTMYDPAVVDAFVADYKRIMPESSDVPHPATRAIGDARAADREQQAPDAAPVEASVGDELLAITSLSRALTGDARVADVGALLWTILRSVLPCETMAIFLPDIESDEITMRYAAGAHAASLRNVRCATGTGIVGWVAVNLRAAVNAEPSLDLGYRVAEATPALRSCLAVPLVEGETLVAVLALYRTARGAFSEDQARLIELLAPRLATSLATAALAEQTLEQPAAASPALTLVRRTAVSI